MTNAVYDLDRDDAERRSAMLREWGLDRPKRDADVIPMRRPPLGLSVPADDREPREDIDDGPVEDIGSPPLTRTDDRAATLLDIDYLIRHAFRHERKFVFAVMGEILGETMAEIAHDLRKEFGRTPETPDGQAALRTEVAELRAALAESRAEVRELKLVQESMRTASRGERGEAGARGVAGRDGQQGPIGPAGPKGEPGARAAGFVLDVAGYSATLVSSDGAPAARLALRPMFEQFAAEIAAEDEG